MTITTREEFEEEDSGEGADTGSDHALPPSAANYRDELLHDSPFPRNRGTRYCTGDEGSFT